MTDKEFDSCMERIVQGDKEGLKCIYDEYLKYIYSIIFTMVGNKENAEDITSDFFIKLWTNAEKYTSGQGHKGYMATIARNMTIDFLRKNNRETLIAEFEASQDEDENGEALSGSEILKASTENANRSLEETVIDNIDIKNALEKLKPNEREVINMKIMTDMTFQEISDILGKPIGTITWWYREAIEKLRRCGFE